MWEKSPANRNVFTGSSKKVSFFVIKVRTLNTNILEENNLGLPKDFFKQFKSKEQFQEFFQEMFKQGVNEMLQGELDSHLGYENMLLKGAIAGTLVMAPTVKE
jgi:hypothetical protein